MTKKHALTLILFVVLIVAAAHGEILLHAVRGVEDLAAFVNHHALGRELVQRDTLPYFRQIDARVR